MADRIQEEASRRVDGQPGIPPEEAILGCRDIVKTFGETTAVDGVSLGIEEGEWLSIVGPNGSGKTSLLNVFNGFYVEDLGQIFFQGEDITGLSSHERARRGIARTFQGVELFEEHTVLENIQTIQAVNEKPGLLASILFYGPARRIEAENLRKAEEIIDYFELWEYRDSPIGPLPLGIRRRIDLARAFALDPDILLLDEPMSGLTSDEKYDIIRLVTDLHEEEGLTIVTVEHDLDVVTEVSERLIVLHRGELIARGSTETVIDEPEVARVYTET